jgi:arylsulfatase A
VKWPQKIKHGKVCSDLVDFSDFLPTICDVADIDIPDSLDLDGQSFFPQLKGKKGSPRKWIYSWYSRNGNIQNASIFARNHKYKLYSTGAYYKIPKDYLEQNPLLFGDLDEEAIETHKMLREVLEDYEKRRLEDITTLDE